MWHPFRACTPHQSKKPHPRYLCFRLPPYMTMASNSRWNTKVCLADLPANDQLKKKKATLSIEGAAFHSDCLPKLHALQAWCGSNEGIQFASARYCGLPTSCLFSFLFLMHWRGNTTPVSVAAFEKERYIFFGSAHFVGIAVPLYRSSGSGKLIARSTATNRDASNFYLREPTGGVKE